MAYSVYIGPLIGGANKRPLLEDFVSPKNSTHSRRYAPLAAAAEYADCSTKTVRRRIADGSLTGYRFGPRIIRVDLNEVDALLSPIPTTAVGA